MTDVQHAFIVYQYFMHFSVADLEGVFLAHYPRIARAVSRIVCDHGRRKSWRIAVGRVALVPKAEDERQISELLAEP